jgi:uroporphyrinogen-III synthase
LKRILITRPEPGATETADKLSALGFLPIVAPVLTINIRCIRPPARFAATVLTSRNAIQACPRSIHDQPVFAVGSATAKHAIDAGFGRVFNADGDAAALAELVASMLSPSDGTLLLPTTHRQGGDLVASLRKRGFRVIRRIAYQVAAVETLPECATQCLRQRQVEAAMFFSGETSRHFIRLLQAAQLVDEVRLVEAVSISERAAVALRSAPWRRISVAANPNQDAMLALLQ